MIAAVIVLYHPDLPLLERLLTSLSGQVGTIVIVDNTPGPSSDLSSYFARYQHRILYIPLGENKGIATAQNIGIRRCLGEGCSHVLLLDQDSCPRLDMVSELLTSESDLLRSGRNVAAVGPLFIDEKNGSPSPALRHGWLHVKRIPIDQSADEPVQADYLIASGSLIRASVFQNVGMMRDELFIDWVDVEWGLRAHGQGYKCYVIPKAVMAHTIGDDAVRALGRDVNLHNDTRNYYIVRNATYLLRLKSMGWRWRTITLLKIPQYILFYSWHSKNKWKSVAKLCAAFKHGCSFTGESSL